MLLQHVLLSAITIQFEQSTYVFDEGDGPAVFVLVLSNPSSTNITVQVLYDEDDNTASGKDFIL